MQYFFLQAGEDGVSLEKIKDIDIFLKEAIEEELVFLSDFPETPWDKSGQKFTRESIDIDKYEGIVIKGEIVVPKVKKFVTAYEIE